MSRRNVRFRSHTLPIKAFSRNDFIFKEKYILRRASFRDLRSIYNFFITLENDKSARKFYRYLPCNTFKERIKTLFFLLKRVMFNEILRLISNKYFIAFIAITNKKVIGINHIDVNFKKNDGEYGIAILREYRGLGLGYMLSILSINYAKLLKVKKIYLTVDTDNIAGLSLYRKLGFKIAKKITKGDYRYVTKEYVDYFVMELNLFNKVIKTTKKRS